MEYTVGLIFACIFCFVGRYMTKYPEKVARIFAFGQDPMKLSVTYFRYCGWFFLVMSGLGVVFYMVLIPLALLGFNFGQ